MDHIMVVGMKVLVAEDDHQAIVAHGIATSLQAMHQITVTYETQLKSL